MFLACMDLSWSISNRNRMKPLLRRSSIFCTYVKFGFGSLAILDVVCRYLLLFALYINIEKNIEIGKKDVKC